MQKGASSKKIDNGKFLQVEISFDDVIKEIKIKGDFFMHPEEAVWELENILSGSDIKKERIQRQINDFIEKNNVQLVGISAADITDCIMEAAG